MSIESVQFTELVRLEYAILQAEREQIAVNIALAELDGEITADEAAEARAHPEGAPQ